MLALLLVVPLLVAAFDCSAVTEEQALTAFGTSLSVSLWNVSTGWDHPSCDAYGVECTDGSVTALKLGGDGLQGELPPEIACLPNLTFLNVSDNIITRVPAAIVDLEHLAFLDVSHNLLSSIPNLATTSLSTVNVSNNAILKFPSLPAQVEILNFSANCVSWPPGSLMESTTLTMLDVTCTYSEDYESFNLSKLVDQGHALPYTTDYSTCPVLQCPNAECPEGQYEQSFNSCTRCPKGYACPGNSPRYQCTNGWYQDEEEASHCKYCSIFTHFSPSSTLCIECPAGSYGNSDHTRCVECKPGNYIDGDACLPCPPGSACDLGLRGPCLPGTAQPLSGQTTCEDCLLPSADWGLVHCPTVNCSGVSEGDALAALYNRAGGENWSKNENWSDGDHCSAYGVDCRDGAVFQLNLASNNLTGEIPEEIACLRNLTYLYVSGNEISEVNGLGDSNLEIVDLSNNNVTQVLVQNSSSLVALSVGHNPLVDLSEMPESIESLVTASTCLLGLPGSLLASNITDLDATCSLASDSANFTLSVLQEIRGSGILNYTQENQLKSCDFLRCPNFECTNGYEIAFATCHNCTAGYSCTRYEANACPPGTFSRENDMECTDCSPGYYALSTASSCSECPAGKFSAKASSECTDCPAGTYAPVPATATCIECTGNRITDGTTCTDCPPMTSANEDHSVCVSLCPAGTIVDGFLCQDCPIDTTTVDADRTQCYECPANSHTEGDDRTVCVADPGYHGSGVYGDTIKGCEPGYECPGGLGHDACQPGTYAPPLSAECSACSRTSIAPAPAAEKCEEVVDGYYRVNGSLALRCSLGHYCQQASEFECDPMTFSNETGAASCFECEADTVSGPGASACTPCSDLSERWYCVGGKEVTGKAECHYGSYITNDARTECKKCSADYKCDGTTKHEFQLAPFTSMDPTTASGLVTIFVFLAFVTIGVIITLKKKRETQQMVLYSSLD